MSTTRLSLVILIVNIVVLAVGIGPRISAAPWSTAERAADTAQALPSATEPSPQGVTIPYPGRLDDGAGQPVADGAYDFTFTLSDAETGSEPLWSEVQEGVAVEGGAFVTLLGSANSIPAAVLDSGERWLAVGVRGPGEADFTTLIPRQRLSAAAPASPAAPSNGQTCPHDHWGEYWSGNGVGLQVISDDDTGVYGRGGEKGVWGASLSDGVGVWGASVSGEGVYGYSVSTHGVHGKTDGNWSYHSGVYGEAVNDNANGVTGWNTGAGVGVYGYSASGHGVFGYSASDHGVYAMTDGVEWDSAVYAYSQNGKGIYAKTDNPSNHAGYFVGQGYFSGLLTKAGGGFKIDHPLDPENKYLYHSFVESPDMKNVYDGVAVLDANGAAWVELPEWFEALNKDFRYQLTPIGAPGPNLYIAREIQNNRFQIAGGTPGMKVSWQVTGIRHDPWAEAHPMSVEEEKPPEEGGTYLHPVEHGMPETSGLHYQQNQALEQPEAGGRQ